MSSQPLEVHGKDRHGQGDAHAPHCVGSYNVVASIMQAWLYLNNSITSAGRYNGCRNCKELRPR